MSDHLLATVAAAGAAGFGLGIGLVLGAFTARTLRRYMGREDMKPYDRNGKGGHDG